MEEERTRMFQETLPASEAERRKKAFVVSRAAVVYRAALHYRESPVDVHARVAEHRAASFESAYEIRDVDQVYAEGTTAMAAYNLDDGRPRRCAMAAG